MSESSRHEYRLVYVKINEAIFKKAGDHYTEVADDLYRREVEFLIPDHALTGHDRLVRYVMEHSGVAERDAEHMVFELLAPGPLDWELHVEVADRLSAAQLHKQMWKERIASLNLDVDADTASNTLSELAVMAKEDEEEERQREKAS